MSSHLEIESKVLLTSDDYEVIKDFLKLSKEPQIVQTNYYFDTTSGFLMKRKVNMRVRHVLNDHSYTLTVKIPQSEGNLEINETISLEDFENLKNFGNLPKGSIATLCQSLTSEKIVLLTSLTTTRYEIGYLDTLLALDYNSYNGLVDYELEVEASSEARSKEVINSLLTDLGIDYTFNNIPKRKRALLTVKRGEKSND